jgi:phosphatidylglycerol:prolipoprotein diacylglycerol transferase
MMSRIIYLRGKAFYSYSVLLFLGFVLGIMAGALLAPRQGLTADQFVFVSVVLTIPALVGSRLLFVLLHWKTFLSDPSRIWNREEGGMTLYGGLALMIVVALPLLEAVGVPLGSFWDTAIFSMLLGMAIVRIGCLLNGCCCGRPTTGWLGLRLPNIEGVWRRRIPTQLLESVFALALFLVLLAMKTRGPFSGSVFLFALVAYGLIRFVLEGTREYLEDIFPLRLISAVVVAGAVASIVLLWRR